jgi:hypothetical protein
MIHAQQLLFPPKTFHPCLQGSGDGRILRAPDMCMPFPFALLTKDIIFARLCMLERARFVGHGIRNV